MGFNYRYLSYVKALKQLIQNEGLGEIVVIRLHFKKKIALLGELRLLGEMIFKVIELVEPLGDLGIHLIDLLWFYLRVILERIPFELKSKQMLRKRKQTSFVDDYAEVYGQLENKVLLILQHLKVHFQRIVVLV